MAIRRLTSMILVLVTTTWASADIVDLNLQTQMIKVGPDGTVSALVYLNQQVDVIGLSDQISAQRLRRTQRHMIVVDSLRDMAELTQGPLLAVLGDLQDEGRVDQFEPFWITNAIRIEARPDAIITLAERDDVLHIYLNYPIELVEPVARGPVTKPTANTRGNVEEGLIAARADEAWAMGFTGEGVLVANIDTGVDGSHTALASRWAGLRPEYSGHPEWAFYDPYTGNHSFPFDGGSHGTHTAGTICGGLPGEIIGVAPGAHWMAAASIDRGGGIGGTVADAILSFQWMVDPDGDSSTDWDVPRVCSNSWGLTTGHGYPNCDQTFWTYLDAMEAAGCVVLFSAGNEGSSGLRRPADRATDDYRTCAVAAIDPHNANYPIASFSSRGPTQCTPSGASAIKPDIAAPGVNTYSSVPGGYSEFSGTSMASPHVNGQLALMFGANPDLEVEQAKEIVYATAMDLGSSGEDNDYGHGLIDCVAAIEQALSTVSLSWAYPDGRPEWLEPSGGSEIVVTITGNLVLPDPDTAMLHIITGSGTLEFPLIHDGGPNFRALFPSLTCGSTVSYYLSVETMEGDVSYSPYSAPSTTYSGIAWSGYEQSFSDDFNSDMGWTVSGDAGTGAWTRATPAEGGDRCDPAADADGSGFCFVTGNSGDEDVDDGYTELTSPNMDASSEDAVVEYTFWYSNGSACGGADPLNDIFVVEISDDGGSTWSNLETVGPASGDVNGGWHTRSYPIVDLPQVQPTEMLRLRFTCGDLNAGSVVEAGVDAVKIGYYYCNDDLCLGDFNGDGLVDVNDLLHLIASWGTPDGDLNNDGETDVDDILILLSIFGQTC